jgi:prevent-host-death family protein
MATLQGSNIVGAYEGKTHLSARLEKVEAGEEFTITKHGAPVAKPVPVKEQASPEERVAAIGRTQMLASALSLRGLRVKDLTSEGRGRARRLSVIVRSLVNPTLRCRSPREQDCTRRVPAGNSHNCKDQSRASN